METNRNGAIDIRNESYRSKLGFTPEQAVFDETWQRLREVYAGRKTRPWIVLGFALKAQVEKVHERDVYVPQPLTPETRFVEPADLDVAMLSDQPASAVQIAQHVRFNLQLVNGWTDSAGRPCVGGSDRYCLRQIDFAKAPIQDHPVFHQLLETDVRRLKAKREGKFVILRTARWVDLCVGTVPETGAPCVLYRLPNDAELLKEVKFSQAGVVVRKGALLANSEKPIPFHRATFTGANAPVIDQIGGDVLSATRSPDLFRLMNRMNKLSTDMTLLSGRERPSIVPPEAWLPRVRYRLPADSHPKLRDLQVSALLCRELGPHGTFGVASPVDGILTGIDALINQDHLLEFSFELADKTIVKHRVPSTVVPRLPYGTVVKRGDIVADYCKRLVFNEWADVEAMFPENLAESVLADFRDRLPIRPGEAGWDGPGVLWPAELLHDVTSDTPWVWDLQPALTYLNEEGTIVGPAIKQNAWDEFTFGGRFTAFFDVRPAFGRISRKPGRKRSRGKPAGKGATAQPAQATSEPTPASTPVEATS